MKTRIISGLSWLLLVIVFALSTPFAEAATEVTSITAAPSPFNPINKQTTTFTVAATPGVTQLEIRILSSDLTRLIRSGLALTETAAGEYTTTWDGKANDNGIVTADDYAVRVFNNATTTYLGPISSVTVKGFSYSPNPFTPTGTNVVSFTLEANPGQTGLSLDIVGYYSWSQCTGARLPLTETATPGIYRVEWTAVGKWDGYSCSSTPLIAQNRNYTLYVYDSAGNQSAVTGQLTINGVSSVSAAPSQFNPLGGGTTTVTAKGAVGLQLEARVYTGNTPVRSLPMTANADTYSAPI